MTCSTTHNGQIPTDPAAVLIVLLAVITAAGQLTTDQAQAITATGGIAELALIVFRLAFGGR